MKKSLYKKQIEAIVTGIEIQSLHEYNILGEQKIVKNQMPYQNHSGGLKSFGSNTQVEEQQQRQNLVQELTNSIYATFYCGIPVNHDKNLLPSKTERDYFIELLSYANTTLDGFDYNWTIYNIDATGNTYVQKNDQLRWLQPNGYQFQNKQQNQAQINTKVNLKRSKEGKNIQPVFYHVFSNEIFPQEAELARFYWNIKPEGATELIRTLTETLNSYKIPFQFKCLNHPSLYIRSDAAVLYIDKRHLSVVSILMREILPVLDAYLLDSVPMFTEKIYKGVSYAEDPGKGMSFGMSRSQVIAKALVEVFSKKMSKEDILSFVIESLESKGMHIHKLHLNENTARIPNFSKYEYASR